MTRRFRLLVAAIFLVLLGIPAVYLAVTWNPGENPLRFRIVEVVKDPFPNDRVRVKIRVENTSAAPVSLMMAAISEGYHVTHFDALINPQSGDNAPMAENGWLPIPERGSLVCTGELNMRDFMEEQKSGGTTIWYHWMSKPKVVVTKVLWWLGQNSPERIQPYLPNVDFHLDDTILEPPPVR